MLVFSLGNAALRGFFVRPIAHRCFCATERGRRREDRKPLRPRYFFGATATNAAPTTMLMSCLADEASPEMLDGARERFDEGISAIDTLCKHAIKIT